MPWVGSVEEQRAEFLAEFGAAGANRRAVCRRWGVSAKTAYKWLARWKAEGCGGLGDRRRRPRRSPRRTSAEMEARILELRDAQPARGARKIARLLGDAQVVGVPALSTITRVLERNGRIEEEESLKRKEFVRFERATPNELWQMDFKGHFPLGDGSRCHPLMVLDDHSRYCAGAAALGDERGESVKASLVAIFRGCGLPESMLMDNGAPWGNDREHVYTPLVVWLIRLGVVVLHGRPRHPQTQGKLERLNRTLKDELLKRRVGGFADLRDVQTGLEAWREAYNRQRPHEALGMEVPASRYTPSGRAYPEQLPRIEYDAADTVRKVQHSGWISYRGRDFRLPKAFHGNPVALRPTEADGQIAVYFCRQRIALIDLEGGRARPVRR